MLKFNSKEWPEVYSCKFLEAGIVSYEDSDAGIALIKKETIDRMGPSFIGRPVIIQHQAVTPANFQEHAVGYVINVKFNPDDAWFYADFIITDDAAKELIDKHQYSVSCAYNVIDAKEGGLWHDIKYDGEITEGSFTHLALVESPRYEDSKISKQLPAMLVNGKVAHVSKNKEELEMSIAKLFKKKENDKQEDVLSSCIQMEDKYVPVQDIMLACLNGKRLDLAAYPATNEKRSYQAQDVDIVDINGKTVSIGELKACYLMKTENAKSEEDKKKEDEAKNAKEEEEKKKAEEETNKKNEKEAEEKKTKEMEAAKNAKDEEEKKDKENAKKKLEADELEKRNAKEKQEKEDAFFSELQNAREQGDSNVQAPAPRTRQERANSFRERTTKKV